MDRPVLKNMITGSVKVKMNAGTINVLKDTPRHAKNLKKQGTM